MQAIISKQTNELVPIGAIVEIKYSGNRRFSLIYEDKWYGDYDYSCFMAVEKLPLNSEYFQVIGYINELMGFKDNAYKLISDDKELVNSLFFPY